MTITKHSLAIQRLNWFYLVHIRGQSDGLFCSCISTHNNVEIEQFMASYIVMVIFKMQISGKNVLYSIVNT